jgi:hypothetical protein
VSSRCEAEPGETDFLTSGKRPAAAGHAGLSGCLGGGMFSQGKMSPSVFQYRGFRFSFPFLFVFTFVAFVFFCSKMNFSKCVKENEGEKDNDKE